MIIHLDKTTSDGTTPYSSNNRINSGDQRGHQRNRSDLSGIMNLGVGLTVNPSATNLAYMNSTNFRAFAEKEKKNFHPKIQHVLSNTDQCASSSALSRVPKTPPNMERSSKLNQRGNSIKCLEVLSKKIASQTRQSKTRKGSRMNKTYDLRSPNSYKRRMSPEEIENDNLVQKMEAIRKDKRNRYEAAVYKKLKEQEMEND